MEKTKTLTNAESAQHQKISFVHCAPVIPMAELVRHALKTVIVSDSGAVSVDPAEIEESPEYGLFAAYVKQLEDD